MGTFKDKVKDILKIEEDMEEEKILALLETIVEEYSRLEDVEFKKIEIEYELVFNKGKKMVKDKIKDFIEEELPSDEACEGCDFYDVNGIEIKRKLEKILKEE